jgi:hypothetical protein
MRKHLQWVTVYFIWTMKILFSYEKNAVSCQSRYKNRAMCIYVHTDLLCLRWDNYFFRPAFHSWWCGMKAVIQLHRDKKSSQTCFYNMCLQFKPINQLIWRWHFVSHFLDKIFIYKCDKIYPCTCICNIQKNESCPPYAMHTLWVDNCSLQYYYLSQSRAAFTIL